MGYQIPCNSPISSSWGGHKGRKPPSTEPGTDYACGYGTNVMCAENGRVVDQKSSTSGGTGRYVTVDLDDGRRVRYLHLSRILVSNGQRVGRGQVIAKSGASGFGKEDGYGAHVHVTLWAGHYYKFGSAATIDFQKYVGGASSSVSQDTKNRQNWLNYSRGERLVVDGIEGPATREAYKRYQAFLKVAVDGKWGPATQAAHQRYYDSKQGNGQIAVDGKWGGSTTRKLQERLGVTQDGKFGPQTIKALQGKLGVAQDGQFGPASKKALQRRLGVTADGIFGVQSIRALQAFINTQGF